MLSLICRISDSRDIPVTGAIALLTSITLPIIVLF